MLSSQDSWHARVMCAYLSHALYPLLQMSSEESNMCVDAEGADVHSPASEGESGDIAPKKQKKAAMEASKRGCKTSVSKRIAQFPHDFSSMEKQCGALPANVK